MTDTGNTTTQPMQAPSITDYVVQQHSPGHGPLVSVKCENSSGGKMTFFQQIIDLIKNIIMAAIIFSMIIVIIGCAVFLFSGKNSFTSYWSSNLSIIDLIIQ